MSTEWDMSSYKHRFWTYHGRHWKVRGDGREVVVFFYHGDAPEVNEPKLRGWYCGISDSHKKDWCGPFKTRTLARLTAELLP